MKSVVSLILVLSVAFSCLLVLSSCTGADDAVSSTEDTTPDMWSQAEIFTVGESTTAATEAVTAVSESATQEGESSSKADDSAAKALISEALNVYSLFISSVPKLDKSKTYDYEGVTYYMVADSNLNTMAKLIAFISDYFSADIVDSLISVGKYVELDGALYAVDVGAVTGGKIIGEKFELVDKTDTSENYSVVVSRDNNSDGKADAKETFEFVREKVDGKFVFTLFPYYR